MSEPPHRPPGVEPPKRFRPKLHYELIVCGARGHLLEATDAAGLRDEDAILAFDAGHTRWHRCLRCDSWVALPRPPDPSRAHPPDRDAVELPLRGRALRDKVVLRLIAINRAFHFLVLGLLGLVVLLFASNRASLHDRFYRVITDLGQTAGGGPVQSGGHSGFLRELDKLFTLRSDTLKLFAVAVLVYALVEGIEAVGLWYQKRWAEYLTLIVTASLLPLEVYELTRKLSPFKIVALIINTAVVVYLLFAKRLFGLRGGAAAERAERERDVGWEALERTAPEVPTASSPATR